MLQLVLMRWLIKGEGRREGLDSFQHRGQPPEKTTMWLRGWSFQPHPKPLGKWGWGARDWVQWRGYLLKSCMKTLDISKLQGSCWLVNTSMNHKGGTPWLHRNRSSWAQDPSRPSPRYLFVWLFICVILSTALSWVLCVFLVNYRTQGVVGSP